MPLVPLQLAPGVVKLGTEYQSKGRWFDSDLIRWYEGSLQPVGGWIKVTDSSDDPISVAAAVRGMLGFRNNSGINFLALGTHEKAYSYSLGVLTEITPSGFTAGNEDGTTNSGSGEYGDGDYGDGPYGGVISDTREQIIEAGSWQFDVFEDGSGALILVGCAFPDATIYSWDLNVANDFTAVANAPEANAIVVTPERFLVALGVGGDRRTIEWANQETLTQWDAATPAAGSQAGDFPLPGEGEILFGQRARQETLIFTTTDLWTMRFIGDTLVYSFQQLGNSCGAVSRHCAAPAGSATYWMTKRGFYRYDGAVTQIPCDVADYVFGDINWLQASKITAIPVGEFSEVTWHYCSAGADENDRYVTYNYQYDIWYVGNLERTAGIDRGAFQYPLQADSTGAIYEHEQIGPDATYEDPAGGDLTPFAESGPVEIGNGDQVMSILYIVPDDKTVGDVSATLTLQYYPDEDGTVFGPFNLSKQTSIRKTARMARLKLTQVQPQWRVGIPRLDVRAGGRR